MPIVPASIPQAPSFSAHKSSEGYRDQVGEYLSATDKQRFKSAWCRSFFAQSFTVGGLLPGRDSFNTFKHLIDITPPLQQLLNLSKVLKAYDGYIFGGAVASAIINDFDRAKDIDVFFTDRHSFSNLPINIVTTTEGWCRDKDHWNAYLENPTKVKEITYYPFGANAIQKPVNCYKLVWYKNYEQIPKSFDFTFCKIGLANNALIYNAQHLDDLMNKKIVITGSLHTGAVLRRVVKYVKRGFTFEDGFTLDQMFNYYNSDRPNIPVAPTLEPVVERYGDLDKDALARYHGYRDYSEYQKVQGL